MSDETIYILKPIDADTVTNISQNVTFQDALQQRRHYQAVNCRKSRLLDDNWIRCRLAKRNVTVLECRFCTFREPYDSTMLPDALMTVNANHDTARGFILTPAERENGAGMPNIVIDLGGGINVE